MSVPQNSALSRRLDDGAFVFEGTYLDAAFSHPIAPPGVAALARYGQSRAHEPGRVGPADNARDAAVAGFARLVNADKAQIAVVSSTMEAENLIVHGLGSLLRRGVITDAGHYDASLVLYDELHRHGMPLQVIEPQGGTVTLDAIEAALKKGAALLAISLVSGLTGFQYDLKKVCDLAHAYDTLVYVDLIQAAGAIPVDVRASGADFAGCGGYKWLMGDFGVAFLYVREDRLPLLERTRVGWRQLKEHATSDWPMGGPASRSRSNPLRDDLVGRFEAGTPAWGALAATAASIGYVDHVGVPQIVAYRKPLLDRLTAELPRIGFSTITPAGSNGPILASAMLGIAARSRQRLAAANVRVSLYAHRIRIAPSIYNDMADIDRLLWALSAE